MPRPHIHFEEKGDGPVLLLIHGGAPGATGMANFRANFDDLTQDYRCICVDLPGFGGSEPLEFTTDDPFSEYADHFASFISELGIAKLSVVGMATGAGIGIVLAAKYPELVEKLVVVAPPGGDSLGQPFPPDGLKALVGYFQGSGPSREKMRSYLELTVADPSTITEEIVDERYVAAEEQWGKIQAGAPSQKAAPTRFLSYARQVETKTLLVRGEQNRVQSSVNAEQFLHALPNASLHIFKDAGLWLPYEKLEEFDSLVRGFIGT